MVRQLVISLIDYMCGTVCFVWQMSRCLYCTLYSSKKTCF